MSELPLLGPEPKAGKHTVGVPFSSLYVPFSTNSMPYLTMSALLGLCLRLSAMYVAFSVTQYAILNLTFALLSSECTLISPT